MQAPTQDSASAVSQREEGVMWYNVITGAIMYGALTYITVMDWIWLY